MGAVGVWIGSTAYNHCFLIIPIAMFMMWERRTTLARLSASPSFYAIPGVLALSMLWVFAAALDVLEARQYVVVAMFEVIALSILGWGTYRALMAPFLYLFLLVPSGEVLVPWLQDFTARFVVIGLEIAHVPVYSDGTIIEIPAGTFVVAEACAGLRFLVASLAFGIFFAILVYRSLIRRIAFIGLSILVPIVANGIRAFGIVYIANFTGAADAVVADHIIYGWGFFAAVTALLILVGYRFSDRGRDSKIVRVTAETALPAKNWLMGCVTAVTMAFAAVGPIYGAVESKWGEKLAFERVAPPAVSAPWRVVPTETDDWHPVVVGSAREFGRAYTNGKERVIFDLALYQRSGANSNLVRAQNRLADEKFWRVAGTRQARVVVHGKAATVGVVEIQNGRRRFEVWRFYLIDGEFVSSAFVTKLIQARDLLTGGNKIAAFVSAATEIAEGDRPPDQTLGNFLNAVWPLDQYLRDLDSDRHSHAAARESGLLRESAK